MPRKNDHHEIVDPRGAVLNPRPPTKSTTPSEQFREFTGRLWARCPRWALVALGGLAPLATFWIWLGAPGVTQLRAAATLIIHPVPQANADEFTVAVTQLENDVGGEAVRRLIADLQELDIEPAKLGLLAIPRILKISSPYPDEQIEHSTRKARSYLAESGAELIIWGQMLGKTDARQADRLRPAQRAGPLAARALGDQTFQTTVIDLFHGLAT